MSAFQNASRCIHSEIQNNRIYRSSSKIYDIDEPNPESI